MSTSSRRTFLALSATAGLGLASGTLRAAPSDQIRVGIVGVRGRGNSLLRNFAAQKDVSIVYLCDIDEKALAGRAAELEKTSGTKVTTVKDYRKILDDKDVDALVLGTPDHWHALQTIHACQAGKDVYTEKPDGHNINEGKAMVAASRKYQRMVQMGTQLRSAPFLRDAAKFVQSGAVGKVLFGKAWETAKQAPIPRVPDSEPPPGVDYDLWLGPAPKRPFNRYRFHGNWRWFFDYGSGDLGNDGVHRIDYCRLVMGLDDFPQSVVAVGGKYCFDDAQEWPDTYQVTYDYPGKILTYEMRIWSQARMYGFGEGAALYGETGWVLVNNTSWKAWDGDGKLLMEGGDSKADALHTRNFLDAVKSRKREELNQEIASGHVTSVLCHAGNIAWRTGKRIKFDPKTETFDEPEANKYLGREYRAGFELPKVD
jgi:predicted dehydrogenase